MTEPIFINYNDGPPLNACTIDLTENCNLACDYCFTWRTGKQDSSRVLKEDTGRKIIKWWIEQGYPSVEDRSIAWWGGEPLLEYELMQRLVVYAEEAAERNEFRITFGGDTNGILYTIDKLEWLEKHKCLFVVSLDGIQPAHDLHRKTLTGEGSWKVIDKNLREVVDVFSQQKVRFSLSPDTLKYFYENVLYFYDIGIRDVAFSPVYEGHWNEEAFELFVEESKRVLKFIIQKHKEGDPIIIMHFNDAAFVSRTHTGETPNTNPCGAGSRYTGWSIDGFMYPCHRFNKHSQILCKDRMKHEVPIIASIYKGWVNRPFRREFWNFKDDPPKKCLECPIFMKSICRGGCYAVNWDLTGSIKTPLDALCRFSKKQHEIGLLYNKMAQEEGLSIDLSGGKYVKI